jgi:hypothetical protein
MESQSFNVNTRSGTLGGTLLVILVQVNWAGLFNTALIAAVGAVTSYSVSVALGWIGRKFCRKAKSKD